MDFKFPNLPKAKIYRGQSTPEQDVIIKLLQYKNISNTDETILLEAIEFYKKAFSYLKLIDLSVLNDNDCNEIIEFLKSVFNIQLTIQNKINFYNVFRVSIIKNSYLDNDKVRDIAFISYPPQKIIETLGVYGRCNSPKSTVFYCSFEPGVAVLETKPQVGQRIIIAHWFNENAKDFNTYPITNNKTIDNESLKSATKAFEERKKYNHPLFAEIMDIYFEFLSSEFVKNNQLNNPKKYEYLFSAFFSDWMLENNFETLEHSVETIKHYDCIIYPSIAIDHKSENLAITPSSVNKLRPAFLEESIVIKTMYENPDLSNNKLPIVRKVIRKSIKIESNKITWSDD